MVHDCLNTRPSFLGPGLHDRNRLLRPGHDSDHLHHHKSHAHGTWVRDIIKIVQESYTCNVRKISRLTPWSSHACSTKICRPLRHRACVPIMPGKRLRPRATVFASAAAGPSVEPGGLTRVAEDTPPFGYLSVPDRNGRGLVYIPTAWAHIHRLAPPLGSFVRDRAGCLATVHRPSLR